MSTHSPVPVPDPDLQANPAMFVVSEDLAEEPSFVQHTGSSEEGKTVWEWNWMGEASENRGGPGASMRTYYQAVQASIGRKKRTYRIGDTVCVRAEEKETWVAQIVNLFEVSREDAQLSSVLGPSREGVHYDLMRCTMRWFYNYTDLNEDTYRACAVPEWIRGEVYFSDHVEQGGYNDVTVISGRAWLFSSEEKMNAFLYNPNEEYDAEIDKARIVRSFVNSEELPEYMRELEEGELEFLLKNPSMEENLFKVGLRRLAEARKL